MDFFCPTFFNSPHHIYSTHQNQINSITLTSKHHTPQPNTSIKPRPKPQQTKSLPPLFKRLPKDFGGSGSVHFDAAEETWTTIVRSGRDNRLREVPFYGRDRESMSPRNDAEVEDYDTFVVKSTIRDSERPRRYRDEEEDEEEEEEGDFSTFVVRRDEGDEKESVSGMFVRKKSGGGGGGGGSMLSSAVASMQAMSDIGKNRRSSGSVYSEDGHGRHSQGKMSSSSIHR